MALPGQKLAEPADHRALRTLIFVLVCAGILLTAWRYALESEDSAAPGDRLWDVEIDIRAKATAGKTTVNIAAPLSTTFLRTVGQSISHPAWRQSFVQRQGEDTIRRISFVATRDGDHSIQAVFSVHAAATPRLRRQAGNRSLGHEEREAYLSDHVMLKIEHEATTRVVEKFTSQHDEEDLIIDASFQFVKKLRKRAKGVLREVPEVLRSRQANAFERAYTLVALSRAARIPARLVKGLVLQETDKAATHFWTEVYLDDEWKSFDPAFGYQGTLPASYLPIAKGNREVVEFTDTSSYSVGYRIINTDSLLDMPDPGYENWREMLNLTRLPLDTRIMLAALLLLPFGVLLTAVFTEVVGVRSYGVFTPTLLSLSLVYVPWQSAIMVLTVVMVIGIGGRSMIPVAVSRVPRLAVVLTLVALGIGASVSLMDFFDIGHGGQLILLPIVILASLVDRLYAVLEEKGVRTAFVRLGWTLIIAAMCIPIVQFEALGHLLVRYPELHLITLAMMLSVLLYTRKPLAQLPAFAWLNWPR